MADAPAPDAQPSLTDQLAAVTSPDFANAVNKLGGNVALTAALRLKNGMPESFDASGKPDLSEKVFSQAICDGIVRSYKNASYGKDVVDAVQAIGGDDAAKQVNANFNAAFSETPGDKRDNDLNATKNALVADLTAGLKNTLANPPTPAAAPDTPPAVDPNAPTADTPSGPIMPKSNTPDKTPTTNGPANVAPKAPDDSTPPVPDPGTMATPPATNAPANAPQASTGSQILNGLTTVAEMTPLGMLVAPTVHVAEEGYKMLKDNIKTWGGAATAPETPEQIAQDKVKDAQGDLKNFGPADIVAMLNGSGDPDKENKLLTDVLTLLTQGKDLNTLISGGTQVAQTPSNPAASPNAAPTGTGKAVS